MKLDLEENLDVASGGISFNGQRVVDCGDLARSKLNVDNRANDTDNMTDRTTLVAADVVISSAI